MKKISKRSISALILASVLLLGLFGFLAKYLIYGGDWAVFPGSPHVYTAGNLNSGIITDRSGTVLLDSTSGRDYADDALLRKATLHLLGDRQGYIAASLLSEYADALVGYNFISGTYSLSNKVSTASLTISAEVQKAALEALGERNGAIGVYNYETGEILCAVSSRTYDPDNVPDIENDVEGYYNGVYVNRFFNATYVPGSIFKIVTAAAALETIPDVEQQVFHCSGSCDVQGDTINCNGVHGDVDLAGALAKSCNVAFAELALQVGAATLDEYAQKLGLKDSYKIDGFQTLAGKFDLSDTYDVDIAWSGIGQYTDLINPCAFMRAMGIIAGEGQAAEPYLMQLVNSKKMTSGYRASTKRTEQILKAETCEKLSQMLRHNVQTVYGAGNFPDLYVCAKSGTAEVGDDLMPHATFAGFVQETDYPLAFIVVVENAGSGSSVCASIAGSVLSKCVQVLDAE